VSADKKVILKINQLCRDYGPSRVVDRLSFEVFNGEFFSLLGPSGCGKSTTLRMIAGLEEPDGGEIRLKGEVVASSRDRRFIPAERRNIGLVFQSYAVWPHMTVKENISYPLELRRWRKDEIHRRIEQVLEAVGLSGFTDRRPTELSGGQQQRLALARCLAYEPDLLLLDEPLSNVDARLREQLRLELKRIQQSIGVTIVYVTHDQSEAMALSHRIAVMQSGKIEQVGTPEEVYTRPATFFVQNFVGRLITFQGRLRQKGSQQIAELPDRTELNVDPNRELAGHEDVCIAVRPESIEIMANGSARSGEIKACVRDLAYVGGYYECVFEAAGTEFVLAVPSSFRAKKGETLTLHLKDTTIWPLAN
jgi:ABC-type Fe3+/spermidine/putrescine transport system ATPase subunit